MRAHVNITCEKKKKKKGTRKNVKKGIKWGREKKKRSSNPKAKGIKEIRIGVTRILNCATTLRAAIVLYHFFFFFFSLFFYLSLNYNGRKFPQTAKVPRKIRLYRANELLSNLKQNFQLESRRLHFYYLLLVENDPFPNNHPRKPFPRCENKRRNNGVVVRVISPVLHFARKTNIKIYASFFFFEGL